MSFWNEYDTNDTWFESENHLFHAKVGQTVDHKQQQMCMKKISEPCKRKESIKKTFAMVILKMASVPLPKRRFRPKTRQSMCMTFKEEEVEQFFTS